MLCVDVTLKLNPPAAVPVVISAQHIIRWHAFTVRHLLLVKTTPQHSVIFSPTVSPAHNNLLPSHSLFICLLSTQRSLYTILSRCFKSLSCRHRVFSKVPEYYPELSVNKSNNKPYSQTYIHSITLDRALASLTGFMIYRYIRCGVISPTINLVLATWYDHQGHLLVKLADTT
jgi:hypothetical protein